MTVKRPVLRYHGGKWKLAPWLISHMPPHKAYVEPFGGGANVLLRKDPIPAEVYNDLDGRVVQVFRSLRDPEQAKAIKTRLSLTPFARAEFDACYEPSEDPIEQVCKTIMLSFMGHGTDSATRGCRTGFRTKMTDSRATPARTWANYWQAVDSFCERLRGVVIENRDASEVIQRMDRPSTLFLVDPPYVTSTRSSLTGRSAATHGYRHEMTNEDHRALSGLLRKVEGMVMLCGYDSELYKELYGDWLCLTRETYADTARARTELLWMNPSLAKARPAPSLYEVVA